ncbi:MAG TPA: hypothetical protein VGS11_00350 [Candidatus Bathyarchaeia archaeon]|nr:hypothetical protein [Candidatus Bathyarchaeia archaeon]
MRPAYIVGLFTILTVLSLLGPSYGQPPRAAVPTFVFQSSPQHYVTLLPKLPSSSPSPWIVYPTNTTIWVAGIATPPKSQIREFFIDGTSKGVLNLTNAIVNSILADPLNPSSKVWFTVNSTLAFYDTNVGIRTNAITFQGQSIQYLANDRRGRIWMSMLSSSGTNSSIAMYDPSGPSNQTYLVPTSGALIQGITVNAQGNTIWFAEAGSKKIGRLIPEAFPPVSEYAPPASINLSAPIQVAVDASGGVWFTDHGSNQFGVLNPGASPATSTWRVFPIGYCPDSCVYGLPNAVFVDAKNSIWFSEHIAGRVGHYDPLTGALTEYVIPSSSTPLMWWAMPGPNNLVWFVAWGLGQIGYVNASIPVPFSLSGPSSDVVVQRGTTANVPVQVNSHAAMTIFFGLSPVTQDQPLQFPAQIYGSSPSNLTLNNNSHTVSFGVSAAWNATPGPRYVALTASNGQVAVNAHVRIIIVEASAPYVALGFSSAIILGGSAIYLRKLKKPKVQPVKKTRR